jgi:hypothetical protein
MKRSLLAIGLAVPLLSLLALWGFGEGALPSAFPARGAAPVLVSPAGDALLRGACFDCHSEETRYPWYVRLPGASFLMGRHVRAARNALNFSRWSLLSPPARHEALAAVLETVREGGMPLPLYTRVHPAARLTPARLELLQDELVQWLGEDLAAGQSAAGGAWEGCPAVEPAAPATGKVGPAGQESSAAGGEPSASPPDDPTQCPR